MQTRREVLSSVAAGLVGCAIPLDPAGQSSVTPASTSSVSTRPLRRDADRIATELCDGHVGALYHLDGVRELNAPDIVLTLDGMPQFFARCDLDPRRDIRRAFGVAPETFSSDGIVVLEHDLGAERLSRVFVDVRGRRIRGLEPAVKTRLAHVDRIVAAPEPHLLVIAPAHLQAALPRFSGRGLPEPRGRRTAFWFSDHPARSVDEAFFPATLLRAELETAIDQSGRAEVRFVAQSTDEAQARLDAGALTRRALEATSVDIGLFRLSLFNERVTFRAEGAEVISETRLSSEEVRWIVAVMARGIPL